MKSNCNKQVASPAPALRGRPAPALTPAPAARLLSRDPHAHLLHGCVRPSKAREEGRADPPHPRRAQLQESEKAHGGRG